MVAGYNWQEFWWYAGGECCPSTDVSGKMVFDLNAGANFTYYASPTATPVTGSTWKFNPDYTKLIINGPADILGNNGCGANSNNKVYEIKEFTADKLVLFVDNASCGSGWVWVFKPAP